MNIRRFRLLACGIVLFIIVIGFAATALAQPSLQWHTDNVYYDTQGRLTIEGYFYNNGSRTVTWVNRLDVTVNFRQQNTAWWEQATATFYDLNVYLNPGASIQWTLRIYNVNRSDFDYWDVRWNANYQYQ